MVGRRAADGGGGALGSAPVIHSVALGGPECGAGLGGSIKWAAVGLVEARHRSELARACASWRGGVPGRGAPKGPTTLG